jgi:hypothetical protein
MIIAMVLCMVDGPLYINTSILYSTISCYSIILFYLIAICTVDGLLYLCCLWSFQMKILLFVLYVAVQCSKWSFLIW